MKHHNDAMNSTKFDFGYDNLNYFLSNVWVRIFFYFILATISGKHGRDSDRKTLLIIYIENIFRE